jgi:hypothetical protein
MQKGVFREQIFRLFYGGDIPDENGLQEEDIDLLIAQAINYFVKADLFQNMQLEGRSVSPLFLSVYEDVAIEFNEKRNRYYVTLPASPISLPHGLATYSIGPMQDEEAAFIPLPAGWKALAKGQPHSTLEGNIGYEQEGNRVYLVQGYDTNPEYKTYLKKVLVKMVADISSLEDEDELPVPGDLLQTIRDYCLNELRKVKTAEKANDDSVNTKNNQQQ